MSVGVGPVESEAGRVRCVGLRAGNNCWWYPVALRLRRELGGDITHGGGEGRGKFGNDTRTRGGNQPKHHTKELVGPTEQAGPTVQQSGPRRWRHVASVARFGWEDGQVAWE